MPIGAACAVEWLLSFVLTFVITAVAADEWVADGFAPIAVGLTVGLLRPNRRAAHRGVDKSRALAARVTALADAYVAAHFENFPEVATFYGVPGRRHDRLTDNSLTALQHWQAKEDAWLASVRRIGPTHLAGRPEWVTYGILREALEASVASRVCRPELWVWGVSQIGHSWQAWLAYIAEVQPVGTAELRAQALARWRALPRFIDTAIANLREGIRRGYTAPRGNVRLVIGQMDTLLSTPPTESPFYSPAQRDSAPAFRREFEALVANGIDPALRRYRDFLERLKSDPMYTFRTREEVVRYSQVALDRAKAAMPKWFGILPKADVVIRPYPAFRERSAGGEYNAPAEDGSRPGVYYISTYEPTKRSRSGPESIAFHETIPGHHLQISIALERQAALHPIARYFRNSGYAEGWALYAERLADEMGLYSSDLDRMGMLSEQAFRAARLVVDPGIHALGWTRERAIDYMLAHTTASRAEVASEVDRYIIWPGQATAYMLGMLEIRRLRERAERALGPKFDVRAFHDRVLEDGAVTLPILRQKLERWIAATR